LTRLMISKYLPSFPSVKRYTRLPLPYSGSLGLHFPTFPASRDLRYSCQLRLPIVLLGFVRSSLSSSDTCWSRCYSLYPMGSPWWESRFSIWARNFYFGFSPNRVYAGDQQDLPSFRVTPMRTCPGRRSRWYPKHSPYRIWDCGLPTASKGSAFIHQWRIYPNGPQLYNFRDSIQSLHPCSIRLQTPVTGLTCGFHYRPVG
jgi:hypothetical protein